MKILLLIAFLVALIGFLTSLVLLFSKKKSRIFK